MAWREDGTLYSVQCYIIMLPACYVISIRYCPRVRCRVLSFAKHQRLCANGRESDTVGVMRVRQEKQLSPVADEVLALTAVIRPILTGVLYALKQDVVQEVGGYDKVKLKMLPRLYRAGDGDCGICFEYAVHEAMNQRDPRVLERIYDAARLCRVPGDDIKSILFGIEKTGTQQLVDTADEILTDDSSLSYETRGRPAKLRKHLSMIAGAFRNKRTRPALPSSIRGLWKADLFIGFSDSDRWAATTVKINANQLEGAAGCG